MRGLVWGVSDNSGIETVKQLKIQSSKRQRAKPGDLLVVFPQKFSYIKIVKRQKYLGLVITLCRKIKRRGGHFIQGYKNSLLILNHQKKFLGSRIFGPVYKEMRQRRKSYIYKKIYARTGYFI